MPKGMIIHLTGPKCSGKSYLLKDIPPSRKFDVADVYKANRVDLDGGPTKEAISECQGQIIMELTKFTANVGGVLFIESSGVNMAVNNFLKRFIDVRWQIKEIPLCLPPPATFFERVKERGLDIAKVAEYNRIFDGRGWTQDEASDFIAQHQD